MGKLLYGDRSMQIDFEDRALAHVQVVITSKLRRNESFMFSWTDSIDAGSGRSTIWIDASIPLRFRYLHRGSGPINRDWIEAMMATANSPGGMRFSDEPGVAASHQPVSHV